MKAPRSGRPPTVMMALVFGAAPTGDEDDTCLDFLDTVLRVFGDDPTLVFYRLERVVPRNDSSPLAFRQSDGLTSAFNPRPAARSQPLIDGFEEDWVVLEANLFAASIGVETPESLVERINEQIGVQTQSGRSNRFVGVASPLVDVMREFPLIAPESEESPVQTRARVELVRRLPSGGLQSIDLATARELAPPETATFDPTEAPTVRLRRPVVAEDES